MSLRDVGEEECFEYDCQKEERKPTREQQETLDSSRRRVNSALCSSLILSPVSIYIELAVLLVSQQSFISSVEYKVKYTSYMVTVKPPERSCVSSILGRPLVPFLFVVYTSPEDCSLS